MDFEALIDKYAHDPSGEVCTSYYYLNAMVREAWNEALEHAAMAFEAMPDGAEYGKDHAALAVRAMKVK